MNDGDQEINDAIEQLRSHQTGKLIALRGDFGANTPQIAAIEELIHQRSHAEVESASHRAWIAIALSVAALVLSGVKLSCEWSKETPRVLSNQKLPQSEIVLIPLPPISQPSLSALPSSSSLPTSSA